MPLDSSEWKVHDICHMKGKPRAAEALELLTKVARQVQPIMCKRQWTVRRLSEFIPKSNNLLGLNVNRGAEIKIRLRPPGQEDSFYSWNHVLGTMLHELCHNQIGPHNAAFYKLLDELWGEAEDLMDRGVTGTGQGFDGPSAGRLGAHSFIPMHNPPQHLMTDAIRKAAEARARKTALMPSGPQKLGGSTAHRGMTPAQAAAAAAERRARDNLWCGAEHSPELVDEELHSSKPTADLSKGQTAVLQGRSTGARSRSQQEAAADAETNRGAAGVSESAGPTLASNIHRNTGLITATASRSHNQPSQQVLQGNNLHHWQEHTSRQQQRRWQRLQQSSRKRAAAEAIDLTLSDDENDDEVLVVHGVTAAAGVTTAKQAHRIATGAGAQVDGLQQRTCSCCSPCMYADSDAAAEVAAVTDSSGALGCGGSRQEQQQQEQQEQQQQRWQHQHSLQLDAKASKPQCPYATAVSSTPRPDLAATGDTWACPICTLVNSAALMQCDACLTQRNC